MAAAKKGKAKKQKPMMASGPAAVTPSAPQPTPSAEEDGADGADAAPPKAKSKRDGRNVEKWGERAWKSGWMGVPNILITHQARLGLEPSDLNVLLHLIARWWEPKRMPYLGKKEMAKAMGDVSLRTVQRSLSRLREREYIVQHPRLRDDGSHTTPEYDLSGLVKRVSEIAQQVLAQRDEAETAKTKKGLKKASPAAKPGGTAASAAA